MNPQECTIWTLVNPPQGKSQADDYCEKCNTWVYKKMKTTCSSLDREVEEKSVHYRREQEKLLKELQSIKLTKSSSAKELCASPFLANERRLVQSARNKYRNIHDELKDLPGKLLDSKKAVEFFNDSDSTTGSDSESEMEAPVQTPNCLPSKYTKEMKHKNERLQNFYRRYAAHSNPELRRLKTIVKS